jgi:hypothetical protein
MQERRAVLLDEPVEVVGPAPPEPPDRGRPLRHVTDRDGDLELDDGQVLGDEHGTAFEPLLGSVEPPLDLGEVPSRHPGEATRRRRSQSPATKYCQ